jgi:hypothetical protein
MKKITLSKSNIKFKAYRIFYQVSKNMNEKEISSFLTILSKYKTTSPEILVQILEKEVEKIKKSERATNILDLISEIKESLDIMLLHFALQLLSIKKLLLAEAKLSKIILMDKVNNLHFLSLEYDTITKNIPYLARVNGALLTLLFFNKIEHNKTNFFTQDSIEFLSELSKKFQILKKAGVEANQMFMIMFTESVNQSITSSAGSSYEDRIENTLIAMGIDKNSITKIHDNLDTSTEFDFFFTFEDKTFGIGAKRTLRERYKQFIKTTQMSPIDVMLQITLGLDLTKIKAESIINHGVFLIISDEIYFSREDLQKINGVYPASQFDKQLLLKLAKNSKQ